MGVAEIFHHHHCNYYSFTVSRTLYRDECPTPSQVVVVVPASSVLTIWGRKFSAWSFCYTQTVKSLLMQTNVFFELTTSTNHQWVDCAMRSLNCTISPQVSEVSAMCSFCMNKSSFTETRAGLWASLLTPPELEGTSSFPIYSTNSSWGCWISHWKLLCVCSVVPTAVSFCSNVGFSRRQRGGGGDGRGCYLDPGFKQGLFSPVQCSCLGWWRHRSQFSLWRLWECAG